MEQAAAEVVLQPVKSWVVPKVEEQFSYVFSNQKHIEELGKGVNNLDNKKLEIVARVEDAKRRGETIIQRVHDWQTEADKIITDSQKFLEETRNSDASCFFKLCYNIVHLYKSGKEAAMFHKKVSDKYQEATNFGVVATPPPVAPIVVSPAATSGGEFGSREKILNEVTSALKDDTINVIGIHGMGGVGKTTLVDKLILQAREQRLFNVVVKAIVSKTVDTRGIQNQIADKIQYKFQVESTQGRRDELCQILSQKAQNDGEILVILDDVWEAIDITTQIGIPRMKCCKVMITSRIIDILRGETINAHPLFEVGVLEDEEAKVLFAKSLGDYYSTIANDSQYTTVMKGLLKRCGGLPLALVTLAGALKGKDHHIWEDALDKLSKHSGRKIEEMSKKVWDAIMFSFDSLQNEEAKKVLLLCSLFPEDDKIPVQKIVSYGFGIDLFEESCRLDKAMRQVYGFIDKLVPCSLLLTIEPEDESDSYCVRLHDIIREVALDIASQELAKLEYMCLSGLPLLGGMCEAKELPSIMLNVGTSTTPRETKPCLFSPQELVSASTPFSRLRVLEITKLPCITSVFPSLSLYEQTLLSLRELTVEDCEIVEEVIASAEEGDETDVAYNPITLSLEKLNLCRLPRLLHFYGGKHALNFPFLDDISIEECDSLISPAAMSAEGLGRLESVDIRSCKGIKYVFAGDVELSKLQRLELRYVLELEDIICGHSGAGALWKNSFPALKRLTLFSLPMTMNNNITDSHEAARKYLFGLEDVLPAVEIMSLSEIGCTEIWHFPPATAGSFSQLSRLWICGMPHIKYVFPSIAFCTHLLTRLQVLEVYICENLEEVVYGGDEQVEDNQPTIIPVFPALKHIILYELPKLKHFYGGRHTLKLPFWCELVVRGCESMKSFSPILPHAPSLTLINYDQTTPEISMSKLMAIDQLCKQ